MDTVNQIKAMTIRVPKAESAFTYFQLEANEGLCFYSTLEESLGTQYRDIELNIPLCFLDEVMRLIEVLRKSYPIEVII